MMAENAVQTLQLGAPAKDAVISVRDIAVGFGDRLILDGLDLDVKRGEILGVVGASGTGKSVLLRTIVGLTKRRRGTLSVFGKDIDSLGETDRRKIERRWGILFQQGALFSSLTVKQNIQMPMREFLKLSPRMLDDLAMVKLDLAGLRPDAADKFPSELSGGMIKRAALARALALDPEILFLDEPTSGLDPIGAGEFDALIATLKATLGLTVFMVTHDLDSLATVCDRIAALGSGKTIACDRLPVLLQNPHPWIQAYFNGPRARAARDTVNRGAAETAPVRAEKTDAARAGTGGPAGGS